MTADVLPEVAEPIDVDHPDLGHYVCDCSDDISLCGVELDEDAPWVDDDDEIDCVVCRDISVCSRCGARFAPLPGGF